MENEPKVVKKKSDGPLFILMFIFLGVFVWFLPQINYIISSGGKLPANTQVKNIEKPKDNVKDKKDATWFEAYIRPLYIGGYVGNYDYTKPNTGTKAKSNTNLLNFAVINTVGTNEEANKYEVVSIPNNGVNTDYNVVPETEITDIINKYFGITFTYKSEAIQEGEWAYYDNVKKAYLANIISYSGSSENYIITNVNYEGYNVTLKYNTTILGTTCSSTYDNKDITTGSGSIVLKYNNGNYNFKSNTYAINNDYPECWTKK